MLFRRLRILSVCVFLPHLLFSGDAKWLKLKNKTIEQTTAIPGWCGKDKANFIMELIKEKQLKTCVEIGVFQGASLIAIANTLKHLKAGTVYAIDCWDPSIATQGWPDHDPNHQWWSQLDYNNIYNQFCGLLKKNNLTRHCKILRMPSMQAVNYFSNETIDFIHFDGNHREEIVYEEVISYFPKIKMGGYILINDTNWPCMRRAVIYLLERTKLKSEFQADSSFLLFEKDESRLQFAKILYEE